MSHRVYLGDCLDVLSSMPDDSVDLIFTSPPYESARLYDELGFKLEGQDWVDWAMERYIECCRVSRGLVAWVVEGRTKQFRWTATPALLMADLHRAGVRLRKPPIYKRVGIPGSGGPDWLRNDYESIICASPGRLPWSDNTAMGKPPKYKPGGAMSNRTRSGKIGRGRDGASPRPISQPKLANPGNIVHCHGGGGHLGDPHAHENEAPFSEILAEYFVRSFCPPGGTVLDCFCGSGTTLAVGAKNGRKSVGIELRQSQIELTTRRLESINSMVLVS